MLGFLSKGFVPLRYGLRHSTGSVETIRKAFPPKVNRIVSQKLQATLKNNPIRDISYNQTHFDPQTWSEIIERGAHKALIDLVGEDEKVCLLLCVSGGIDSIAMLHILLKVKEKFNKNLSLQVVNFNHKLRPEADEEVRDQQSEPHCVCFRVY
jgi:acyl carrier protein